MCRSLHGVCLYRAPHDKFQDVVMSDDDVDCSDPKVSEESTCVMESGTTLYHIDPVGNPGIPFRDGNTMKTGVETSTEDIIDL